MPSAPTLSANRWQDYQLLDCSNGMKQERWGKYTLVRPDPQIIWPKPSGLQWTNYDAYYHRSEKGGGQWETKTKLPDAWQITYHPLDLRFQIRPTSFKHTGLFPEQAPNWEWITQKITAAKKTLPEVKVLNLFGYTGAATIAAAKAGAHVCHIDAAEGMVKWCRQNAELNNLHKAPVRYITDDCLKFTQREQKRGNTYHAIIMDPPTYGRGANGQMWKLEDHLWPLLNQCLSILDDNPLFILINAYTARLSPTILENLLTLLMKKHAGTSTTGEVAIPIQNQAPLTLPCGIYARWESKNFS